MFVVCQGALITVNTPITNYKKIKIEADFDGCTAKMRTSVAF